MIVIIKFPGNTTNHLYHICNLHYELSYSFWGFVLQQLIHNCTRRWAFRLFAPLSRTEPQNIRKQHMTMDKFIEMLWDANINFNDPKTHFPVK